MKRIALTQGKFALVDNSDYAALIKFKWHVVHYGNSFYVERIAWVNKKNRKILMHRQILGLSWCDGKYTDHRNRNGLDNRRDNLRVCNHSENLRNRDKQQNNTSGYKGVSWHRLCGKWQASIKLNNRQKHLGLFDSPIVAAQAYNEAAIKYHGEFARINQIGRDV